jgi:hypothetical protein
MFFDDLFLATTFIALLPTISSYFEQVYKPKKEEGNIEDVRNTFKDVLREYQGMAEETIRRNNRSYDNIF